MRPAAGPGVGTGAAGGLAATACWPELAAVIRAWLPQRRFFGAKDRPLAGLAVHDVAVLSPDLAAVIVRCDFADGGEERYQVPVVATAAPPPPGAAVIGALDGAVLLDGATVPAAIRRLAAVALHGEQFPTTRGHHVQGHPTATPPPLRGGGGGWGGVTADELPPEAEIHPLGVEQSNSSAVLGGGLILKVFRKLEQGTNPDVEVTAALTLAGFPHVPRQHGAVVLEAGGDGAALAVLSDLVPGAREGWAAALAEVAGGGGAVKEHALALGATVAQLHEALREAFGDHAGTGADTAAWARRMQADAARVLARAGAAGVPEAVAQVATRGDEIMTRLAQVGQVTEPGPLVRVHGDLHLGQVLLDAQDRWVLLDFEGEPARPLAERRAPSHPLRDVAGMLRSFDYAAAFGAAEAQPAPSLRLEQLAPRPVPRPPGGGPAGEASAGWRDSCTRRFLDGYRFGARRAQASDAPRLPGRPRTGARAAQPAGEDRREEGSRSVRGVAANVKDPLWPRDPGSADALLAAFTLEKAVYELGYELANRPQWAAIPAAAILRLLDDRTQT